MKTQLALILTAFFLLHPPPPARAQCADWLAGPLDNGSAPYGADGNLYAAVSWDPDGAGPLGARLVVGGAFMSIGGVPVSNIAQRDPASGQWSAVGDGLLQPVYALTVFNGQLVAGGNGDNNVGTFDVTVHRWDGSTWVDFPATNTGDVLDMAEYNGELYIAGTFMTHFTTGNPAYFLARHNPAANLWEDVESGVGQQTNTAVRALTVYNGDLYIGGNVPGVPGTVANLARWNPATHWTQITTGTDLGAIYDLALYGGEVIVAGGFLTLNGEVRNCIAGWNGASFHGFSSGTGGPAGGAIYSVIVHNGLVVGGLFQTASGLPASRVAFWPPGGSAWQSLGGGTDNTVQELVSYNGELVAVGNFLTADQPANHIAHWNGSQWGPFGGGTGSYVLAMAAYNGRIVAGGDFHQSTAGLATAHNIAGWSGGAVQAFGTGMNGAVWALESFKYPSVFGSYELIAGGTFTQAGGLGTNCIARWNENPTSAYPPPAWQAMGAGFNNAVYAIERSSGVTYAGGAFSYSGATNVNYLARWNETTDVWEPVGFGMNGFVYALKEYNGYLYAGGNFTSAGGSATGGLARWNGSWWEQVGGYFLGIVLSLEVHGGQLVIGGQFTGINSSPNLARYDGSSYSTFGTGGANSNVRTLKSSGARLYVGGDFTSLGGVPVSRIGYWDGAWHDTQYGTDNIVYALGTYNGEVHAGGDFVNVDFGGAATPLLSPFWGRYSETGLPWFTAQPSSRSISLGDDVTFAAQPAAGFTGLSYQWYRDDVPLGNGPTGYGATISGANTPILTVSDTAWPDQGGYRVEASNGCGAGSSWAATLNFTGVTAAPSPGSPATTVFETVGPNPSGGATVLEFSLARDAAVRFHVHDVRGRLIRRIEAGHLPAGRHQARWDAHDGAGKRVAAGMYFLRLEVDGRGVSSKRLTILH